MDFGGGGRVHAAIESGDVKALKQKVKKASSKRVASDPHNEFAALNDDGMTVLAAAIRGGNAKVIAVLLQPGALTAAELNLRDEHGYVRLLLLCAHVWRSPLFADCFALGCARTRRRRHAGQTAVVASRQRARSQFRWQRESALVLALVFSACCLFSTDAAALLL